MKRTRIVGLCLVAALALTAFAASSASALPEIGRCVAKSGGKYTEGNCLTKGSSKNPGTYEFVKNAVNPKFTTTGGHAVLETESGTKVECESQSASGEYLAKGSTPSTKEVKKVVARFASCTLPIFGAQCNTKGDPAGEIVTSSLTGKLGYTSKSKKEVAQELHPEVKKGLFTEFECTSAAVIKVGEKPTTPNGGDCVLAAVGPTDVMSTTATEEYVGAGGGKQAITHFEGKTNTCNLESSLNGGAWEKSSQSLITTITNSEALEIKA